MTDKQIYQSWLTAPDDQLMRDLAQECGISRASLYIKIQSWELALNINIMLNAVLRLIKQKEDLTELDLDAMDKLQKFVNKYKAVSPQDF